MWGQTEFHLPPVDRQALQSRRSKTRGSFRFSVSQAGLVFTSGLGFLDLALSSHGELIRGLCCEAFRGSRSRRHRSAASRITPLPLRAASACRNTGNPYKFSADSEAQTGGAVYMGDLLDFHRPVVRNLCVQDGEGAGAARSRSHWERRFGGEIVEWEEGDSGVRFRIHPSSQPPEVSSSRLLFFCPPEESPGVLEGIPEGFPFLQNHPIA